MLLALYLTTTLAVDTTGPAPRLAEAATERPAVIVHRQPAIPLVALRLSILADDPPGYAGAGHLVQHLVEARLRERVERVGGGVRLERSSDAVVFMVSGPAAELEYLAGSLGSVLSPPRFTELEILRASRQLAEERLAEWETASSHVRAALRGGLFPDDLPPAGTEAAGLRLVRPAELSAAWSALYRPERVSIVAVGDVGLADVEAAFGEIPGAADTRPYGPPRDTSAAGPLAPAEATRGWLAIGYPAADLPPSAVSVATRLAGDALRARLLPAATVEAEHWWSHHGQALVLVVAVPGSDLATTRAHVGAALTAARDSLTAAAVASAARAIRRDFLFYSRTPERMAEVLGRFSDRAGEPDAAQRYYSQLEHVRLDDVREAMELMLERSGVRVEIPPQPLPRS